MFKCGQRENKNYTFGITEKQMKENEIKEKEDTKICCSSCGVCFTREIKICPSCGKKK